MGSVFVNGVEQERAGQSEGPPTQSARRMTEGDRLRLVESKATALANSLALVCGSSAVPAKLRKPLEAVLEAVGEIIDIAQEPRP